MKLELSSRIRSVEVSSHPLLAHFTLPEGSVGTFLGTNVRREPVCATGLRWDVKDQRDSLRPPASPTTWSPKSMATSALWTGLPPRNLIFWCCVQILRPPDARQCWELDDISLWGEGPNRDAVACKLVPAFLVSCAVRAMVRYVMQFSSNP